MSCLWWLVCLTRCQTQLRFTVLHPGSIPRHMWFYSAVSLFYCCILSSTALPPEIWFLIKSAVNGCSHSNKPEHSHNSWLRSTVELCLSLTTQPREVLDCISLDFILKRQWATRRIGEKGHKTPLYSEH